MRCPFCGNDESQVVDSRLSEPADAVRRRRVCRSCERRFTTYERYDEGPLYIRKRSGRREPFDRAKVLAGLERAAIKRPVERDQLEAVVDRIVAELRTRGAPPASRRSASWHCGDCAGWTRSHTCGSHPCTASSKMSRSSSASSSASIRSRHWSTSTSSSRLATTLAEACANRGPSEPGVSLQCYPLRPEFQLATGL